VTGARFVVTNTIDHIRLPQGWRVRAFDALDSTNAALKRMVEAGTEAAEGLIVAAKSQTAGRGRSGRTWASPPGNVYASFLIEAKSGIVHAPETGFVAAVAVVAAIQALMPDRASDAALRCKWPNDVLFEGAKVAGILPETTAPPETGPAFVVLGIGLNLVPVRVDAPYPVTSLAEHGAEIGPGQALEALARQLAHHLDLWRRDGFAPIRRAWLDHAAGLGEEIVVQLPRETVTGRFVDLDADGALIVDNAGQRRRILAGDVILPS